MRLTFVAAAAALLASCGAPQQSVEGCSLSATQAVTWSDASAQDVITASAQGPSCAQAVVTLVIRDANGDPLWTVAQTYADLTTGGRVDPETTIESATVQAFLDSWVDVTLNTTEALPAWPEGADTLGEAVEGMAYYTELDRDAYERLRERALPQLCYAAAVETSQCLVIDPQTDGALRMAAFGA